MVLMFIYTSAYPKSLWPVTTMTFSIALATIVTHVPIHLNLSASSEKSVSIIQSMILDMGRAKHKGVLEHAQNAQIQTHPANVESLIRVFALH